MNEFENGHKNVIIDKDTIRYIYSLISTIKSSLAVKYEIKNIKNFHNKIFNNIGIIKESRDGLTNILAYEADIIITCIENNIKNNFIRHFNKYINIAFDIKKKLSEIVEITNKSKLWSDLRKIKNDILSFETYSSEKKIS